MSNKILWCDHTINPGIYGCTKVSEACDDCYAMRMAHRQVAMGNYPDGITVKRSNGVHWSGVVKVDYDAIGPAFKKLPKKKPGRVFLTSMADLFHEDVPDDFISSLFSHMAVREHLTFQVLTKRPQRMAEFAEGRRARGIAWPRNVWAGCTVENQERADERIPWLLKVPAPVRFLSMEPLREAVDISESLGFAANSEWPDARGIQWVIAGGESGSKARPSHPDWFRSLRDQCQDAGVAFHFKQWGEWAPASWGPGDPWVAYTGGAGESWGYGLLDEARPHEFVYRAGKKATGRMLDGREWAEFPS